EPIVGIALRHKFQGVRSACRVVVHEADGSFDHPFRSFKPKDGVCVTLPSGVACINQHLQTGCILPNCECLGLSLSLLAWSATATGKYVGRIPQKIAERINVVNTMKHYFEMFTLVDPRPETPVGVAVDLDCGVSRCSKPTLINQHARASNAGIPPHLLIHGELHLCTLCQFYAAHGLRVF